MFAAACASTARQLSWQEFAKPKMAAQLVDPRQKQASGLQTGFFRQQNNSRDGWKKVPFLQKGTFPRCFRVPGIYIYIILYILYIWLYNVIW